MKLGVLGGMFDPIHRGHLRAAENARAALLLDEVAFVPAGVPPHRDAPVASSLDRFAMVALATAPSAAFVPWDGEIVREGPSYTVDTVSALLDAHPGATVTLILGADNLGQIHRWKEPERLLALCDLAVVARPGATDAAATGVDPARVHRVEGSDLPIASSDLRQRIRDGKSVRDLVPDTVCDYISKRGLYR